MARPFFRSAHFYLACFFNGFALCIVLIKLPDLAVQAYGGSPDVCRDVKAAACAAARSQASLATGLSNGAKAIVTLLLGPVCGSLSDVYGRRYLWLGAQAACLISYLALYVHLAGHCSILPFLILNALGGLNLPAWLGVVADENSPAKRAGAFGKLMGIFDISLLLGPVLFARAGALANLQLAVAASFIALLLSAAYGETLPASDRLENPSHAMYWRPDVALGILNSSPLFRRLSIVIFASTLPIAGTQQCFLLFLEAAYGMSAADASGLFAILALSGLFVQVLILPLLGPRIGTVNLLLTGLILQGAQAALFSFVHFDYAVVAGCVAGGFGTLVFPTVSALKANAAPVTEQGRVQGAISSLQSFALALGPLLYGSSFSWIVGPNSPFGHPLPQAVFVISIFAIFLALTAGARLSYHIPGNVDEELLVPPVPRRIVSVRGISK
jgi:DHA1 family tetracycline resistance protein-like MFS transporter